MSTAAVDHPEFSLRREGDSGFVIEAAGADAIRLAAEGDRWIVEGRDRVRGWALRRSLSPGGGFVLSDAGGAEIGRTSRQAAEDGSGSLLTDDGRLFRIAHRGPRRTGLALTGWETSGPYLVAGPESNGWRVVPTAACGGLPEIEAISILFAAELIDADRAAEAGAERDKVDG